MYPTKYMHIKYKLFFKTFNKMFSVACFLSLLDISCQIAYSTLLNDS